MSTNGPERSAHVLASRVLSWGISLFHHESGMQVEAACRVPWLKEVILDFLEVHGLEEAVGLVKAAGKKCILCTPRCEQSEHTNLLSRLSKVQPRLRMQQFVYLPRLAAVMTKIMVEFKLWLKSHNTQTLASLSRRVQLQSIEARRGAPGKLLSAPAA